MATDFVIYKAETDIEGLEEKIRSNATIAYQMPLTPWHHGSENTEQVNKIAASFGLDISNIDFDLYPVKSVLVTTNWKKNDDVFGTVPTWKARHTPIHKPTNIEHNEEQMVGHIIDTWVIDNQGKLISDITNPEDLPNMFHICTSSVIYRNWENPELVKRSEKLIEEIEAGNMFVSMECLFTGFDYALTKASDNGEPEHFIVNRDEDSAYLTKHLRVYGGSGKFKEHKIGRLLKNITFSGKGFVEKPANPNSIIFTNEPTFAFDKASYKNPFIEDSGVYLNKQPFTAAVAISNDRKEKSNMSGELELLQAQLAKTEAALDESTQAKAAAEEKLAEAGITQYESQIAELNSNLESAKKQVDSDKKTLDESQAKTDELVNKIDELTQTNSELSQKMAEIEKEKQITARVSTLVSGGLSKEDAEDKVSKFTGLSDEQFDIVAETVIGALKAGQTEAMNDDKEEAESSDSSSDEEVDEAEANADVQVLEEATSDNEEVAGATEDVKSEDAIEVGRVAIANYLSSAYLNCGEVASEKKSEE